MNAFRYIHNNSQEKSEEQLKEENITKNIVRQINRVICNKLADKLPHIFSAQVSKFIISTKEENYSVMSI